MNYLTKILLFIPILFFLNLNAAFSQIPDRHKLIYSFDKNVQNNHGKYQYLFNISNSFYFPEKQSELEFQTVRIHMSNFECFRLKANINFKKTGVSQFEFLLNCDLSNFNQLYLNPEEIFLSKYYDKTSDFKYTFINPLFVSR